MSTSDIERTAQRHRLDAFLASRDVAGAITLDALKRGVRLDTVIDVATDLAAYADEAIGIVIDEYRPALECQAGCWYCCAKPGVLVSKPELVRLIAHVRMAWSVTAVADLTARARQYVDQLGGRSADAPTDESFPCPFLVDGRCSVYAVRPLVCRGYNSTSADACRRAYADGTLTVPMFAVIKDVTDGATVGAAQALSPEASGSDMFDLGTALHLVLSAGPPDPEAVLSDASRSEPAANRSFVDELWNRVRETARQVGVAI